MTNQNEENNLPVKRDKAHVPIEDGKFAPKDFDGLYRLATIMTSTEMVPSEYHRQPEKAFVAMQMGMEVGLSFMASLQCITVVKGKPTIYADGVTGLINGSGKLEDIEEGFKIGNENVDPSDMPLNLDEWPDNFKAYCIMKRKGRQKEFHGSFSVADAKRMGKWNKPTKSGAKSIWQQHPARMLQWRARTFPARDGFSDVLKGLSVFEEVIDYDADMVDTNGQYEVKEEKKMVAGSLSPKEPEWDMFCATHGINIVRANKFIAESAQMTGAPILNLVLDAMSNKDDFIKKFKAWSCIPSESSGPSVENKADSGPQNEKNEPQKKCTNPQCPHPECEGCVTHEVTTGEASGMIDPRGEEDPVDPDDQMPFDNPLEFEMRKYLMDILVEKDIDTLEADYIKLFGEYVDHVCNKTGYEKVEVFKKFLSDSTAAWFDFFIIWRNKRDDWKIGKARTAEDSNGEDIRSSAAGEEGGEQSTKEVTEDKGPSTGDATGKSPAPSDPNSFISEWVGMTGKVFKEYVPANLDRFQTAPPEELKKANEKWNKLVYARFKEEWPLKQTQGEIKFPEKNAKQQLFQMAKEHPEEVKKSLAFRGFANTVATNDAAQIVINDVLEILGGRVLKK